MTEHPSQADATESPDAPAKRILVVEDNPAVGQLIVKYLTRSGFTPYLATDGKTAIDWLASVKPILILLDITLPDFDGSEVFTRIRSTAETAHVPVIFITGLVGPDEEAELNQETGENKCYMGKPFTRDKLLACIAKMLGTEAA